jgi:hypothetical protein
MKSVPGSFWMWLSTLKSDDLAAMATAIAAVIVVAIGIVCTTIYKVHKTRADDSLKRELLDRGLSAEEIATVIGAKPAKSDPRRLGRF